MYCFESSPWYVRLWLGVRIHWILIQLILHTIASPEHITALDCDENVVKVRRAIHTRFRYASEGIPLRQGSNINSPAHSSIGMPWPSHLARREVTEVPISKYQNSNKSKYQNKNFQNDVYHFGHCHFGFICFLEFVFWNFRASHAVRCDGSDSL